MPPFFIMSNKLLTVFNGATVNPLASVPWVAQWKFNNNGNDSIGANTLTNNNSATFTTGKLGGATGATQLVAASSQYWSITNNATIQPAASSFLIAAWVYLDSNVLGDETIISKGVNSVTVEFYLARRNDNSLYMEMSGTGTGNASLTASFATGQWHFVIGYYNATTGKCGVALNHSAVTEGTVTGTPTARTGDLTIGLYSGGARYWNGRIDNVCYAVGSNAILTQAIHDALWNDGNGIETLT